MMKPSSLLHVGAHTLSLLIIGHLSWCSDIMSQDTNRGTKEDKEEQVEIFPRVQKIHLTAQHYNLFLFHEPLVEMATDRFLFFDKF